MNIYIYIIACGSKGAGCSAGPRHIGRDPQSTMLGTSPEAEVESIEPRNGTPKAVELSEICCFLHCDIEISNWLVV